MALWEHSDSRVLQAGPLPSQPQWPCVGATLSQPSLPGLEVPLQGAHFSHLMLPISYFLPQSGPAKWRPV